MNAAALTASRPLIPAQIAEKTVDRAAPRGKDPGEVWRAARQLLWSLLCLLALAVLLIGGCVLAFGILAMVATVLGGREGAWWPVIACIVLLYLVAKGCIICWDAARGRSPQETNLRRR
jgi:hypothetical protein